jgi:hypothetical protein
VRDGHSRCCREWRSTHLYIDEGWQLSAESGTERLALGKQKSAQLLQVRHASGKALDLALFGAESLIDGLSTDDTTVRVHCHDDILALTFNQVGEGGADCLRILVQSDGR